MIGNIKNISTCYSEEHGLIITIVNGSGEILTKKGESPFLKINTTVSEEEQSLSEKVGERTFDNRLVKMAYIQGIQTANNPFAVNPYDAANQSEEFIAYLEGRTYALVLS